MPDPMLIGLLIADPARRREIRTVVEGLGAQVRFEAAQFDWEALAALNLNLLVADERPGGVERAEFVRKMKTLSPGTLIVPPLESSIRSGLERAASPPAQARIIGFLSAKGGSGATTVACHIASALARLSRQRVLLADCDLDLPLVGFLTRCAGSRCLLDAVGDLPELTETEWNGLVSHRGELDVLPYPKGRRQGHITAADLRQVFGFLRSLYGWVVADLGRGLPPLFEPVLADFDDLFVVTTLNVPAIFGARDLLRRLTATGIPPARLRLVLNRLTDPAPAGAETARPLLGAPVAAEIAEDRALDEAYAEGELAAPTTAIGRDLEAFAARLAGLPAPRSSRWPWLDTWRRSVAL